MPRRTIHPRDPAKKARHQELIDNLECARDPTSRKRLALLKAAMMRDTQDVLDEDDDAQLGSPLEHATAAVDEDDGAQLQPPDDHAAAAAALLGGSETEAGDDGDEVEIFGMRGALSNTKGTPPGRMPSLPTEDAPDKAGEVGSTRNADADAAATTGTAEATASNSVCLPAGQGERSEKRKRKPSGGARRAAKAAKKAEDEEGGYTDKGRTAYRRGGGRLVSGTRRTCVPDALVMLLDTHGASVSEEVVRTAVSDDLDQNVRFLDADTYTRREHGLQFTRVTKQFMRTGGVAYHVLQQRGRLLAIQLRITNDKDDSEPDLHVVAFDGSTIRDNAADIKVKIVGQADRGSPEAAHALFDSLAPGLLVRIKNVYELMAAEHDMTSD